MGKIAAAVEAANRTEGRAREIDEFEEQNPVEKLDEHNRSAVKRNRRIGRTSGYRGQRCRCSKKSKSAEKETRGLSTFWDDQILNDPDIPQPDA